MIWAQHLRLRLKEHAWCLLKNGGSRRSEKSSRICSVARQCDRRLRPPVGAMTRGHGKAKSGAVPGAICWWLAGTSLGKGVEASRAPR